MKAFDSDDIKNEILSGDESRIALALRRARDLGFDADKFYASLLDVCSFLENKNKKLYSLPGLMAEIEANGLMLRNMNLKSIPACFAALCDLADRIDISKNDFSEFPIVLLEFKQLKKLNLSDNKLTKLPDSFINFKLLEELDLSANFFVKMPEILSEIKFLKSLKVKCANPLFFKGSFPEKIEKLHINFSKTFTFPEEIYSCVTLKILELEGISELPEEIIKFEKLEVLSIHRSGLETLPESIAALTNLNKISLCNLLMMNKLPEVIFNLSKLEELDLSGTLLLELPAKLRLLKNLKRINLSGCNDEKTLIHWKKRCESWGINVLS
jgi:Leucine-rich repeat (LRR) protein